jgi:hypothetical protein
MLFFVSLYSFLFELHLDIQKAKSFIHFIVYYILLWQGDDAVDQDINVRIIYLKLLIQHERSYLIEFYIIIFINSE